jgi:hypothetical protein
MDREIVDGRRLVVRKKTKQENNLTDLFSGQFC